MNITQQKFIRLEIERLNNEIQWSKKKIIEHERNMEQLELNIVKFSKQIKELEK